VPDTFTATIQTNFTLAGLSFSATNQPTADAASVRKPVIPLGFAGDLTTRTDDDTGVVTLDGADHGLTDSDFVDVYWIDANGVNQVQYKCAITDVTSAAITINAGIGTVLPAQDTAVTMGLRIEVDLDFAYADLVALGIQCPVLSHIEIMEEDDTTIMGRVLANGVPFVWIDDQDTVNPLDEDVGKCWVSNGTVAASVVQIGALFDGTP